MFALTPGPRAKFGKITITGLDPDGAGPKPQEIPEAPLRRAINIEEGEPYSTAAIDSATQALLDLEVFSAVEIVPSLPDRRPRTRRTDHGEARAHAPAPGAPRRRPRVRSRSRRTFTSSSAGRTTTSSAASATSPSTSSPASSSTPRAINNLVSRRRTSFPEERLRLQLKQPGFLEARTNAFIRPEFNVFPLLVQTVQSNTTSDEPVVGYFEVKGAVGVERSFGKLYAALSYNVQVENPFAYTGLLDPLLTTLVISYPELVTQLDLRNDRLHPHSGVFLGNTLQVAGGIFGGDAQDVKVQPEVRTLHPAQPQGHLRDPRDRRVALLPRTTAAYVKSQLTRRRRHHAHLASDILATSRRSTSAVSSPAGPTPTAAFRSAASRRTASSPS